MSRPDPFWLIVIGAVLVWGTCLLDVFKGGDPTAEIATYPTPGASIAYQPFVYMDRVTGCQYLSTHLSAGLVPRIAADGKTQMGCKGGGNGQG